MDFSLSDKAEDYLGRLQTFFDKHIFPNEKDYDNEIENSHDPLHIPNLLNELKVIAKNEKLWNLFLPDKKYGPGLSNLDYAPLAELMGQVWWSSEVFNCSAPDTGNMEILAEFGTEEQKAKWLEPLLEGEIRSCFGMTEPGIPSSDATNIQSSIVKEGDAYIINGRKWWTSNAVNPNAKLCIFMGITNPDNPPYQQQSQILIPLDTEGVNIIRPMKVYGYDDGYTGHPEVSFTDVRVPVSNIIGDEGSGFAIAQARLGPGRIHHCMRTIGLAERALELMINRAKSRSTFGKKIVEQGVVQDWIAESRIKIEQARLLTFKTAWLMDTVGKKGARTEISAIKVAAVDAASYVVDKAIQTYGAEGLSQDTPLARMSAGVRALRFADGPEEVHKMSIAKREINKDN